MLPLGFMKKTQTVEAAAASIVKRRTGLDNLFLTQFKLFSEVDTFLDENINSNLFYRISGRTIPDDHWMFKRKLAVGFYTLTEYSKVKLTGSGFFKECQWWEIDNLPQILFDPGNIIGEARNALRRHIHYHPVGFKLLEEKFTLPEIHALYQTLLAKKLDERNFAKKLLKLGVIVKLAERKKIGGHRSPNLYSFNMDTYYQLLEEGIALL